MVTMSSVEQLLQGEVCHDLFHLHTILFMQQSFGPQEVIGSNLSILYSSEYHKHSHSPKQSKDFQSGLCTVEPVAYSANMMNGRQLIRLSLLLPNSFFAELNSIYIE